MQIDKLLDSIKVGLVGCIDNKMRKVETNTDDITVSIYWVGDYVLRVDIKGLETSSRKLTS